MKLTRNSVLQTFVLLVCTYCVNSYVYQGASSPDFIRDEYIQLEAKIWSDYVENDQLNRNYKLYQIIDKHQSFLKKYLRDPIEEKHYNVLSRFYEWNLVEKDVLEIHNLFEATAHFIDNEMKIGDKITGGFEERAALDLAETILHDAQWPVNTTLQQLDNIIVGQGLYYRSIQEALVTLCSTQRSPQQILYQLYNAISLTELKGYTMMQFSYMLLKTYDKGNFTQESQLMRKNFEKRVGRTQDQLRKVLERADRTLWRCDPKDHVEGKTYLQLTRLLQGYIENEVDMNNQGGCWENCGHYQLTESYSCYKELYCSQQPKCRGKLLFCTFVDSDMWICPAKTSDIRRYDYIEYESGRLLGQKTSCTRGTTKVDSWWRYLFWHCSYCFCICDEQGKNSDRFFSLRPALSNVTSNMIVTGVRFVKKNRIIHLQIQEGQLLERGVINITNTRWMPVSDFTLQDRGIRENVDYHTMTWDKREIDFDDLKSPAGHVVTGVKFRLLGRHLNMEMRVTEIDFASGRLIEPDKSFWVSNDNTDISNGQARRTELALKLPDIPTRSKSKSVPISTTNSYIKFTYSDMGKDASQTTVPFLDAQDVVNDPPVPLEGVGLFLKGQDGFGGFITPKIMTFDYGPYVQKPLPTS